jgi:AcrR family transcriptional regulator
VTNQQPTAGERPLRADARRNRERILDAARCACAEHGASVQMDDVAGRAGVGVGTVYRHFATKEALLEELVAERFRTFAAHAREALEVDNPWEAFAGLLRRNAEVMAQDAGLRHALVGTGGMAQYTGEDRVELDRLATQVIGRAQEAGVLRDDISVEDIPMLMSGLCASMGRPRSDWHRHLELLLDAMRPRR